MHKKELKAIAEDMFKELISIIDSRTDITKDDVTSFLNESAQIIMDNNEAVLTNSDFKQSLFHNAHKEIADKSISSYAESNSNIEILNKMQGDTLQELNNQHIDIGSLSEKFSEIQLHMAEEVKRANEVISQLSAQIRTLEEKSNLDSLTKVYNRRALTTHLEKVCSHKKLPYHFHLLMLDLDDFKIVNDTHGHIAGDKVLIFIANIFRKTLRDGDKVFRYGGEEFIIVLNRIDKTYRDKITSRLLNLIRGNKLIYKGETLSVTISIGVTEFTHGDTPNSLIARADKALYRAKQNGKDQVCEEAI